MGLLISGMIIFFGIHLVPALPLKNILIQRFGKNSYMGVFALIAALGLGLMIYGKSTAGFIAVWQPLAGAHWLPVILMWPAFVLLAWAEIPCSIKFHIAPPHVARDIIILNKPLICQWRPCLDLTPRLIWLIRTINYAALRF